MNNITEKEIQKLLYFNYKKHKYHLFNTYVFQNESDYFSISPSGYTYEGEVKLNYQDFKNDFSKERFNYYQKFDKELITLHLSKITKSDNMAYGLYNRIFIKNRSNYVPNYFFYVCPENVIPVNELNNETGLIYVKGKRLIVIKKPKILHKNKYDNYNYLLQKYYWKYINNFLKKS